MAVCLAIEFNVVCSMLTDRLGLVVRNARTVDRDDRLFQTGKERSTNDVVRRRFEKLLLVGLTGVASGIHQRCAELDVNTSRLGDAAQE